MKILAACVLLLASVAVGQLVRGATVQTARAINAPAPAGVAPAAPGGAAPAPGAPGAPRAPVGPTFGPAFFGPGINNPIARGPVPQLVARAQEVVASNPNVRVFVDVDGAIEFTDQFGREVEVLDSFGRDALEVPGLEEQLEFQKQQAQLNQRRALLMQQLAALNTVSGHNPIGAGAPPAPLNRFVIAQ